MQRLATVLLVTVSLFGAITDTTDYTIIAPPTSTTIDSCLYTFAVDVGRANGFLYPRDMQKIIYSIFNLSDSIKITTDGIGFFKTDDGVLLQFVQDTVFIPFVSIDALAKFPKTPDSNPVDSLDVVNKRYVDEIIFSSSYQDSISITHSYAAGTLLALNKSTSTWGYASAYSLENISGDCQLGIALSGNKILLRGWYTTVGLSYGYAYYVGTSSGTYSTTRPSASGNIIRIIGRARSTTILNFNPSHDWMEVLP